MKYKRILLKLSGEWLANKEKSLSVDYSLIDNISTQLKKLKDNNVQIAIVIGGGNFWRGASAEKNGIPRNRADYIGMLATIMNALALQSGFEKHGLKCRVQSSITIDPKVAENYITEKAIKYLNSGEIVIFAAGTGRPYFTTDTAATLVASEIKADIILLGKNNINGIYDSDPNVNKQAKKYSNISYDEILNKNLKVIDSTAATMARDNNIDALVFNIGEKDSILNVVDERGLFTKVSK